MNFELRIKNCGVFLSFWLKKIQAFVFRGRKAEENPIDPKFLIHNSQLSFRRSLRLKASGFTLIELLIVLVILSLLAALVGPSLVERLKPAKRTVAQTQIEEFSAALDNFYVDAGRYPQSAEGLSALREKPTGVRDWKGPYLKKDIPNDPWGNPYVYRCPGLKGPFDIVSYGADGKEGGEGENADVNSWQTGRETPQEGSGVPHP